MNRPWRAKPPLFNAALALLMLALVIDLAGRL